MLDDGGRHRRARRRGASAASAHSTWALVSEERRGDEEPRAAAGAGGDDDRGARGRVRPRRRAVSVVRGRGGGWSRGAGDGRAESGQQADGRERRPQRCQPCVGTSWRIGPPPAPLQSAGGSDQRGAGVVEDAGQHLRRQPAGEGVLLAGMEGAEHQRAAVRRADARRRGRRPGAAGRHARGRRARARSRPRPACRASTTTCDARQRGPLALEERQAGVELLRRRLVVGRRAADRRGDLGVAQLEPVAARLRASGCWRSRPRASPSSGTGRSDRR